LGLKASVQFGLLLLSVCSALAQRVEAVVPGNLANVEGDTSVNDFLSASSLRMQMVYDASQFSVLPNTPDLTNSINSIWFRLDGVPAFDPHYLFLGASVTLSITPRGPDGLSPIFADNVGANPVTVFNGSLGFGAAYQPGMSPQPFAETITLTTPFFYSPSQGNLLVDIAASGGQVLFPGALDAQLASGDPVSRVFSPNGNSSTGTPDTLGLVTRFNIAVIPEPAMVFLVAAGLVLLLVFKHR
jgi:hypothetical protein